MNTNLLTTQWHTLPEETVRRLQVEKLRRYLRDVVVPFSPHYRALFHEHGFAPDDLHTLEDLDRLPLTSKLDLSSTPEHPNRIRDFLVLPDKKFSRAVPRTFSAPSSTAANTSAAPSMPSSAPCS